MVAVSLAISSLCPFNIEGCCEIPPIRTNVMPGCIEHLNNLEKDLVHVLVTIQFCTFIWIEGQEEYVHGSTPLD
jgi:hypothetical protein